ncbi:hypothetical protein KUW09_06950 [Mameliella alba]|nr:hypothetical protein [Antarctobacter heliothermus]MBY6143775.1 hypothetical protein [Mameliella alba]MCA0952501.1 hypothetical protein [Mameliella alba]
MSYSANEIAGLAQKAARGAGFPPRQADLFGAATVRYLADGGPPEALDAALADPTNSPILRLPLLIEDILRAVKIVGPEVTLTMQPGDEALAVSYAELLPLGIDHADVDQTNEGLPRLTLRSDPQQTARRALPPRIEAPAALVDRLTLLARETYVPASDTSRDAGAGAGDIDND